MLHERTTETSPSWLAQLVLASSMCTTEEPLPLHDLDTCRGEQGGRATVWVSHGGRHRAEQCKISPILASGNDLYGTLAVTIKIHRFDWLYIGFQYNGPDDSFLTVSSHPRTSKHRT